MSNPPQSQPPSTSFAIDPRLFAAAPVQGDPAFVYPERVATEAWPPPGPPTQSLLNLLALNTTRLPLFLDPAGASPTAAIARAGLAAAILSPGATEADQQTQNALTVAALLGQGASAADDMVGTFRAAPLMDQAAATPGGRAGLAGAQYLTNSLQPLHPAVAALNEQMLAQQARSSALGQTVLRAGIPAASGSVVLALAHLIANQRRQRQAEDMQRAMDEYAFYNRDAAIEP